ncbi:MAG: hypothetical protein WAV41_01235 [Microgenomates group bacterium]
MTRKMVILDKEKIIPTDYPRYNSARDLARAKQIGDINFEGVVLEDTGDGNLYVKFGHHRIARALEIGLRTAIEVEVVEASEQAKMDIRGARYTFEKNGELRNYDEYIERIRWLRGEI